jgi:predicted membrane channel-forming protein YqfA (hemolysin III family)
MAVVSPAAPVGGPAPRPRLRGVPDVYGYHDMFHTCTLVGFATHYIAVALAVS